MKKIIFLFCGLLLSCSSYALSSKFDTVVVFGDSLSDNGNLYKFLMHYIPSSPPYANGRFSNGKLWIEYLFAEFFQGGNKNGLKDYAIGGAGAIIDSKETTPYTLDSEINDYLYFNTYGKKGTSLYVVWIGANNYLSGPSDVDAITGKVVSAINDGIEKLIKNGANKFFIANLPDMGRLPDARKGNNQNLLTQLTLAHNQKLAARIDSLKTKYPKVIFTYFDAYSLFNQAISHSQDYGLTNITDPCYKGEYTGFRLQQSSSSLYQSMQQQYPDLSSQQLKMVQNNPVLFDAVKVHDVYLQQPMLMNSQSLACDTYLFWDHVHPTTNVHRFIGLQAKTILDDAGFQPIIH